MIVVKAGNATIILNIVDLYTFDKIWGYSYYNLIMNSSYHKLYIVNNISINQ